jgi:aspartokinase/homoserine dehydrogenase 1
VNSGDFDYYRECRDAYRSLDKGGMWLTEATCGAGLPVIKTIRSLVQSGDTIESIKGIFSGTMSYLFNTWKAPEPFSELVSMAKISGYTEPDPRQDLNGLDVARKVVILARECGLNVSLGDVSIEGLVPESLVDCSVEEFITKFPLHNESLSAKAIDAASRNCVLRFLGSVDIINKKVSVSLTEVDSSHVFASLTGADNILEITSARYGPNGGSTPMIIRGPGAGAAVTAGGVVGDVLDLARIILHRS